MKLGTSSSYMYVFGKWKDCFLNFPNFFVAKMAKFHQEKKRGLWLKILLNKHTDRIWVPKLTFHMTICPSRQTLRKMIRSVSTVIFPIKFLSEISVWNPFIYSLKMARVTPQLRTHYKDLSKGTLNGNK
jgi:hypothetical protein